MNLHEYQAKDIFRRYGIPVPAGQVAANGAEAVAAAKALGARSGWSKLRCTRVGAARRGA